MLLVWREKKKLGVLNGSMHSNCSIGFENQFCFWRATDLLGLLQLLLDFHQQLLPVGDVIAQLRSLRRHTLQLLLLTPRDPSWSWFHTPTLKETVPPSRAHTSYELPYVSRGRGVLSNGWLQVPPSFCQFFARSIPGTSPRNDIVTITKKKKKTTV